ncbi:MAG: hypothetical protein ABIP39_02220, partial [Polyangiaceae bacterium]
RSPPMKRLMMPLAAVALVCGCEGSSGPPAQMAPPPTPTVIAVPAETQIASSSSPAAVTPTAGQEIAISIADPTGEGKKSITAKVGDTISVTLPEYPGTMWKVTTVDRTLGYPKEETVPSYLGPNTPGRKFVWATGSINPLDVKGSHVVTITGIPLAGDANEKPMKFVLSLRLD